MADGFIIDDSNLRRFIFGLSHAELRLVSRSRRYIRKMTKFTEKKMKLYTKFKSSNQSTGKLRDSISSRYVFSKDSLYGEVFVPSSIEYQFAAEYGIKKRHVIKGSPKMTFSADRWKKPSQSAVAVPLRGYFVFTQVTRGKYRGKFFTKRSFEAVNKYFDKTISKQMPRDLVRAISIGR